MPSRQQFLALNSSANSDSSLNQHCAASPDCQPDTNRGDIFLHRGFMRRSKGLLCLLSGLWVAAARIVHSRRSPLRVAIPRRLVRGALVALSYLSVGVITSTVILASENIGNDDLLCAWPIQTTPDKANIFYPDANATYWTMPFFAQSDLEITIKGDFPNSRYFGIDVYGSDSLSFAVNGVDSTLADYQIGADPGGANPWQTINGIGSGSFTVRVNNNVAVDQPNVLPLSPTPLPVSLIPGLPNNMGYLMLRVYLPKEGDPNDTEYVRLPTLTLTLTNTNEVRELVPCDSAQSDGGQFGSNGVIGQLIKNQLVANQGGPCEQDGSCPELLSFAAAGGLTTPFPNGIAGYVAALYQPAPGYISVVQARMPSSSRAYGDGPAPWPENGTDLRYWSFCNYLYQFPFPVIGAGGASGCVADYQAPIVGDLATLVLSSIEDRPVSTLAYGSTLAWLPTSPSSPAAKEVVAIRNMLPSTSFQQSVTNISQYGNPDLAKQIMGIYYPVMTQCTIATFDLLGVEGCFANPASPTVSIAVPSMRDWQLWLVALLLFGIATLQLRIRTG